MKLTMCSASLPVYFFCHQWIHFWVVSTLLQVMVCHLFSTKSSPERCYLIVNGTFHNIDIRVNFYLNLSIFIQENMKMPSAKYLPFCSCHNMSKRWRVWAHLNIKMPSYQYKDSYDKDNRNPNSRKDRALSQFKDSLSSYMDSYTVKMTSLYWDAPQALWSQQILCNHGSTSSQIYHVMHHDWQTLGVVIIPISFLYITRSYYVSPD